MRMTQDTLANLNACGTYLNVFRSEFPETDERYVDGVEMTAEVCESRYDKFDWSWASEIILSSEGNAEWNKLTRTRNKGMTDIRKEQDEAREAHDATIKAWQTKHEQPYDYPSSSATRAAHDEWNELQRSWSKVEAEFEDRRSKLRATSFGQLAQDDKNLSQRYHDAVKLGITRRYQRRREELTLVERELENVLYGIRENESRVVRHQREVDRLTEQRPAIEERLTRQRATFARFEVEHTKEEAERTAREAQLAAERAAQAAKTAQDRIAEIEAKAEAAVQAVAALDAKATATATDDAQVTA